MLWPRRSEADGGRKPDVARANDGEVVGVSHRAKIQEPTARIEVEARTCHRDAAEVRSSLLPSLTLSRSRPS